MYEKFLGAKVASSMDYNMEYDHDDIAATHGSPEVVFMLLPQYELDHVEEKHFNKDQYDEAVAHMNEYLSEETQQRLAEQAVLLSDSSLDETPPSPSPSDAASVDVGNTDNLAATAIGFTFSAQEIAAAQRRQEQANKPKPERPQSVAYESALKPNDSRMAHFKRTFSPQQIKDRGAMISNIFSDILDDAVMDEIDSLLDVVEDEAASEESKTQARQRINSLRDPVNGRQLAAQALGIPQIINMIKEKINAYMEYADDDTKPLYQNTLDYFEELFNTQATLDIEEREGIRIIGLSVAEQTQRMRMMPRMTVMMKLVTQSLALMAGISR